VLSARHCRFQTKGRLLRGNDQRLLGWRRIVVA
jgi:hypothetical protein